MKMRIFSLLIVMSLAGCSMPGIITPSPTAPATAAPLPTMTLPVIATPVALLTQVATVVPTPVSAATAGTPVAAGTAASFCEDQRVRDLITAFGKAVADQDGALLASLVSPALGMDVRFYRDGNVINYDVEHAQFVFETTYQADWGISFGSGLPTIGAFHEIIVPTLEIVFTPSAQLFCNQLKVGGATYTPAWPYPNMNYYSVHFPGTNGNSGLDWQTWAVGMDMSSGAPKLAALMHFVWEP